MRIVVNELTFTKHYDLTKDVEVAEIEALAQFPKAVHRSVYKDGTYIRHPMHLRVYVHNANNT